MDNTSEVSDVRTTNVKVDVDLNVNIGVRVQKALQHTRHATSQLSSLIWAPYTYGTDLIRKPVTYGADLMRTTAGGLTWGPLVVASRRTVTAMFERVQIGTLVVRDQTDVDQRTWVLGQPLAKNSLDVNGTYGRKKSRTVTLTVKQSSFWVRLLLFADMGFAESYMLDEVGCDDLTGFFELFIQNRSLLADGRTWTSSLSATITSIARSTNTMTNSLLNIVAHYDISNDLFRAFLSEDMTYSCPIWRVVRDDDGEEESLESAQITKLQRFIDGCRIKSTDHVLEIGTGWGSFAISAARQTGCRVTSLTLSIEQKELAEQKIREAGLAHFIEVKLMDYRRLPTLAAKFDKVVSIEMLEAVGAEYLETYFQTVHRVLKHDGVAMFQCITMPENRYAAYAKGEDFIRKYVFPGGHLPSISQLVDKIQAGSGGTLVVERIENIGGHYAKTLRLWRENFLRNFDSTIKPALMSKAGGLSDVEAQVFCRKWEYYFSYCEAGFASKTLGDVIITVGREGAMELMEGIPL